MHKLQSDLKDHNQVISNNNQIQIKLKEMISLLKMQQIILLNNQYQKVRAINLKLGVFHKRKTKKYL